MYWISASNSSLGSVYFELVHITEIPGNIQSIQKVNGGWQWGHDTGNFYLLIQCWACDPRNNFGHRVICIAVMNCFRLAVLDLHYIFYM